MEIEGVEREREFSIHNVIQKSMYLGVNFFLAPPSEGTMILDLEIFMVSSCARLAVSENSGGRCSFCGQNRVVISKDIPKHIHQSHFIF